MDQFIDTIEDLILWFFIFGAILWAWLSWIVRRQQTKRERDLELADVDIDAMPIDAGAARDRQNRRVGT